MRHAMHLLWLGALAGCEVDDLAVRNPSTAPSAEVDYDGSWLGVSTCIAGGVLGCNPAPTDSLYVIVDGETYWGAKDTAVILGGGELEVTTKAPWDGQFVLAVDLVEATIDLPSGFTISLPTTVSRADGPVPVAFDLLDNFDSFGDPTVANMRVHSTCDAVDHDEGYGEVTPGEAEITFDDVAGATGSCTHAVTISEWITARDQAIPTTIVRTEVVTFTSSP